MYWSTSLSVGGKQPLVRLRLRIQAGATELGFYTPDTVAFLATLTTVLGPLVFLFRLWDSWWSNLYYVTSLRLQR